MFFSLQAKLIKSYLLQFKGSMQQDTLVHVWAELCSPLYHAEKKITIVSIPFDHIHVMTARS